MGSILTVWAITFRGASWLVVAGAILLVVPLAAYLPRIGKHFPSFADVTVPLCAPLLMVVWAGLFWAHDQHQRSYVSTVHTALLIVSLVAAAAWPFVRFRSPGVGWSFGAAAIGFFYSFVVWFVGGMAITNQWL